MAHQLTAYFDHKHSNNNEIKKYRIFQILVTLWLSGEPGDSCDDSSRFSRVVDDDSIVTVPMASNSSTDATLLDEASDQMYIPSLSTQIPLTTCPNDTCNLETIKELSCVEESLGAFEVLSSPLTPENYPVLFSFLNQPHSQNTHLNADKVIQADYHEVAQPSPMLRPCCTSGFA